MTSSKISTAPWRVQRSRNASRKPGAGGTTPMFPATGSTMTAAISRPRASKIARTPAMSLNDAVTVKRARLSGTPALSGMPNVAPPDPAFTSRLSAWP